MEGTEKLVDFDGNQDQSNPMNEIDLYRYWQDKIKECKALNAEDNSKASGARASKLTRKSCENLEFSRMYSELIHSGKYTERLMRLEQSYRPAVDDMLKTRDVSLEELQKRSSKEIELAISQLGQSHTESSISCLSSQHCQDMERLLSNWNMSIEALKDAQREEFHDKLKLLYNELMRNSEDSNPFLEDLDKSLSSLSLAESDPNNATTSSMEDLTVEASDPIQMEESFTINLGSQLKTAHNLRVLAVESLSLCDSRCNRSRQVRTQTAMSLYSHNLSAIVFLVDNHFQSYFGIQHEFEQLCNSLNDFHFDSFNKQIKHIRNRVMPAYAGRRTLELGDCYVTKHSNLANVHVVFHLVTDDSLKTNDVNSRHPIMSSLRNILRVAHMYDIKTISIPLLLVDEMDEEILTVSWCLKRAELVLKCVKGFLIEMASLSTGVQQGTIQFLVPKGISEELFTSLASLIPEIFRLANSLNLKTTVTS